MGEEALFICGIIPTIFSKLALHAGQMLSSHLFTHTGFLCYLTFVKFFSFIICQFSWRKLKYLNIGFI